MKDALVALGANLPGPAGSPKDAVERAMAELGALADGPVTASALYGTPAFPAGSGPDYVNAAVRMTWAGSPGDLLAGLHEIERGLGRTRDRRWEARIVDLDLLAFGDAVLPDAATEAAWRMLSLERAMAETPETLVLPHPRLAERAFVIVPLAEIAPDWRHPVTGKDVAQMLAELPPEERAEIRRI